DRLTSLLMGASDAGLDYISPPAARRRKAISSGKQQMLDAVTAILDKYRRFWPLTLRTVHYRLAQLPEPPLPDTDDRYSTGPYTNNDESYKDLSNLVARARIARVIPWESLTDETRPVSVWRKWSDVGSFVQDELEELFGDYRRDLLQSQPAHIEIVAE